MSKKRKEPFIRLYSRVRKDQLAFVKARAEKMKVGEGEMTRIILDYYMSKNK